MKPVSIDQAAARRTRDLAAIHASAKKLGLDRGAYEAILVRITGKVSSADLNAEQRQAVLKEFSRLGAARPRPVRMGHPGKPHNADSAAMPEMLSKIEAQLADMRLSWAYADAIGKRMFGIARIAWLRQEDQLKAIIAALHVEQEKRSLNAAIDDRLRELGWEPERLVTLLRPLRPNWRRHRESLGLVLDYLTDAVERQREAVA